MGILGYPNMDDNNQDGVFGDYSDVYSNYSEDATTPSPNGEEYADVSFDKQAQAAANVNVDEQVFQEENIEQAPLGQEEMTLQQRRAAQAEGNSKSNGFVLVLLVLALVAAGFYYYKNNMAQDATLSDTQAMGDYFYDAAGGAVEQKTEPATETKTVAKNDEKENIATIDVEIEPAKPATVDTKKADEKAEKQKFSISKKLEESKKQTAYKPAEVVVPVSSGGRLDPFMPYGEKVVMSDAPKFDIVAPPVDIPDAVDPAISNMSSFKISGIMYDDVRPSAILRIDGTEQLVHKGDIVAGYNIKDITRTKVVVKYNSNTYEVAAGEAVNLSGVNVNPVSTLNKQFGGAYTNTPENVIKFY